MNPVPHDYFSAQERLDVAEERYLKAKAKVHRLRTSINAPFDPVRLKKAQAALNLASNAMSAARLAVSRYS